MFQFNRELAARAIEFTPRTLFYLEAWSFTGVTATTSWNFRTGILDNTEIEDWLHQEGSFSVPIPPHSVGRPDGGLRLLACDYTLFKKASLGMSRRAFEMAESILQLHPATLPSLEVATGTFSRHFSKTSQWNSKLSIILKAPQKYEIGNYMLSLTHDVSSRWTTALLAGESIVDGFTHVQDMSFLYLGSYSPCTVIRAYLSPSPALWTHPLTLPCIIVTDHLKRLHQHCSSDLTRRVMFIEEQLGVTRVGRRNSESSSGRTKGAKAIAGKPVERPQAEYLTVNINTQLTRLLFTGHAPKWNYGASDLLMKVLTELVEGREEVPSLNGEILGMLEHNISLAKSIEDHVLGLQKRLELQLNVLYSFVAQTDNRLSARLAATSGRDSTSMKILAFITTIFLPGTYIATLFSMNMFNWEESSSDTSNTDTDDPTVSPRFWIYWAVSAPLTALTLAGWAIWWSFEKHRYDDQIQDTMKSAEEIRTPPWWRRLLKSELSPGDGSFMVPVLNERVVRDPGDSTEVHGRPRDRYSKLSWTFLSKNYGSGITAAPLFNHPPATHQVLKQSTRNMSTPADKANYCLRFAQTRYEDRNPKSKLHHEQAVSHLPGGNTRSVLHASPFPLCIASGKNNRIYDHDGHEYLDLIGDMTAGIFGHSHRTIIETIASAMTNIGLSLGAMTVAEPRFAEAICNRFASIEQIRFCNSGTEANLYALSVALHVTGLSKVIIFEGAYHGGVLQFAHGIASNNVDKNDWIIGPYNNIEGAKRLIAENKGIAAAVLVEPMQGAGGCIPGTPEFLHAVQKTAQENGIIFILDEVMTSRLAPGGLQSVLLHPNTSTPLGPDLTTLGKWIGGGLSIGAFGGRQDLLSVYDPRSSNIQHSGTFNNNTLAMNVGYKALTDVYTPEACIELNMQGDDLLRELQELGRGTKMAVTGIGAVMTIHFLSTGGEGNTSTIRDFETEPGSIDANLRDLFWFHLIERGFWISRRGMLSLILGTSKEEIRRFQDIVRDFLQEYQEFVTL
ncbi:pyridoxal phosphate-dependent transferase [Aspergillus cavernicola]|uniref:Pyridoxal phosphate-dependent transferase n=1 Tax=Aspergillus cavernicola TaxID=176166 RepID=A0ABR4IFX6_9EURO